MVRPPPSSTLFPYTTLFRSADVDASEELPIVAAKAQHCVGRVSDFRDIQNLGIDEAAFRVVGALAQRCPGQRRVCRRSEEHTSELQSLAYLVCRLLLEKKNR